MNISSNSNHRIIFYKDKEYYSYLKRSKLVITSGGISLFDAIFNKRKIICIPQYEHQKKNAIKILKKDAIRLLNLENKRFNSKFTEFFYDMYDNNLYQKKINVIHDKIINSKMLNKTLNLISKTYANSKN